MNSTAFKGTAKKVESVFYLSNQLGSELGQDELNIYEYID
jgi:hypothetical protein